MRWASAVSEARQLDVALGQIADSVGAAMQRASIDLAVLFVSHHFAEQYEEAGARLAALLPHGTLLGCSAGGVIGGGREVEHRPGVALTVAHLPNVAIVPFSLDAGSLPDADAPPSAWHTVLGVPPDPVPHLVVLADPYSFPVESLLEGLDYAYPRSTKIGGLASGARQPGGNALYTSSGVRRRGAIGVALSGDVCIDTVVAQGCRPIGNPMQITRCHGTTLHELDGRPALEVLQKLVHELSETDRRLASQALFLGIVMNELASEERAGGFLIRNLMGVDPTSGALAIGENLRRGQTVQFHVRDARTSAEDLESLLRRFASEPRDAAPRGALLFSCLGRGSHLYGRPDHDTDLFRAHLGELPLGGFFCNGEIGPVSGATHLHGFTSSFGLFRPARPR